jgi:hypothetical protein
VYDGLHRYFSCIEKNEYKPRKRKKGRETTERQRDKTQTKKQNKNTRKTTLDAHNAYMH